MATGAEVSGERAAAIGRWRSLGPVALIVALCPAVAAGCGSAHEASSVTTAATAPRRAANSAAPTFAHTVKLQPVSGTVRVKRPGTTGFIPLSGARTVSLGTVIDVRTGSVRLTAAFPTPGHFAVADFQAGEFAVQQRSTENGLTDLRVLDTQSERTGCGAPGGRRRLIAHQLGLLLGDGHGRLRTDGRFSAATVRGTKWGCATVVTAR